MATIPFSTSLATGVNVTPDAAVPAGTTGYRFEVNVTAWTAGQTIALTVEFSQDSWASVVGGAGLTVNGGPHTAKDGATPALPGVEANMPPGSGWRVRGRITVPAPGTLTGNVITRP